jgi:hypothetical protein
LLYLNVPATAFDGRCAVLPVGTINPPVVAFAIINPPAAVMVTFPVLTTLDASDAAVFAVVPSGYLIYPVFRIKPAELIVATLVPLD